MRAARLTGLRKVELVEMPRPEPQAGQVRIRVQAVGICGSDMHAFAGSHPFVHPPIVLGHEIAGVVDKLGPSVDGLREGQLVTVEPNIVCGECHNCRHGRYNICEKLNVIGCVGYDGGQAEFLVVPAEKVFAVPENWTVDQAVMVEPTAVGVHAVRQAALQPGQDVLVLGAGVIGLVTMEALKAMGAGRVMITDLKEYRLELAGKLGADYTVNPAHQNLEKELKEAFGGKGADLIMDCVGIQATLDSAINLARKGTRIVMVGVPEGKLAVNMAFIQDRELELVGTLMYRKEDYLDTINFIDSGKIAVEPLITHRYPLEKVMEVFELAMKADDNALKVLLTI